MLRVQEGLTYPEIAARQNASVPAVKMRVARGLRELRDRFAKESRRSMAAEGVSEVETHAA